MKLLSIETSCDETAISIIERTGKRDFKILSNLVSSQVKIHEPFGGVVPNLARREHEKNLVPLLIKALRETKLYNTKKNAIGTTPHTSYLMLEREQELQHKFIKYITPLTKPKIDAVAVTYGPGLAPALWAGVNFARALSALWNLPLVPANHMEGHIFSALIGKNKKNNLYSLIAPRYPAIALLVSGGHTELHLIKKLGEYKRLGETIDDAAGETFDKVARMLNLKYPGGPEISKHAEIGNPLAISFPRPMIKTNNFQFSFSGLKTSVLYYLRDNPNYELNDVAASFEEAVVETLVTKTFLAAKKYKARTILVGGGVAANKHLRECLLGARPQEHPMEMLFPNPRETGDNALMIALAALFGKAAKKIKKASTRVSVKARPDLRL